MRKLAFLAAAVPCLTFATPRIVAVEQAKGEIQIIADGKVAWACCPGKDSRVPEADRGRFRNLSEVKPRNGGKSVLFACSHGAFGQLDLRRGQLDWYGFVDAKNNPHSIDRLPDGRALVISSTGNNFALVDFAAAPFEPAKQKVKTFPIEGGHGIVWDETRRCVWALGKHALERYEYAPHKFDLVKRASHVFATLNGKSYDWGHDLVMNDDGTLTLTVDQAILVFDPEDRSFREKLWLRWVKGYARSSAGELLTIPNESWWTDRLKIVKGGKETVVGPFEGARFYKARWLDPDSPTAAIFAPKTVGVQPSYAVREMCRTADGEYRHYGWAMVGGVKRRVYVASRDAVNWSTHLADADDAEAMVRSPYSGEWVGWKPCRPGEPLRLVRSKTGPGDLHAQVTDYPWPMLELRQLLPLRSRKRWVAVFSNVLCERNECYHATVALSDDDGVTWRRIDLKPVADVARLAVGDKRPHWFNNGCEPTVAELSDGTLVIAVRTSGPHAAFYRSKDGGETWSDGKPDPAFWQANTMPYFFRLKDGRLLFIWNNTVMLPTRDASEYPELGDGELSGQWESVFTNRDALHAAISDDDGATWHGFREIALNEIRNRSDFRELGNTPAQEHDKSVHQTQALELDDGKVLLAYGQNESARRLCVFDPDWLLEKGRHEDFRHGLDALSTHLYLVSMTGGNRGWAGHCAWNRVTGAALVRDPDTDNPPAGMKRSVREVLQICRIKDERLVCDRQGAAWNFPAARKGELTLECRVDGAGFRLSLLDHWINPSDETNPQLSPVSVAVDAATLGGEATWTKLTVAWDEDAESATVRVGDRVVRKVKLASTPRFGLSYLHLQTLAEGHDPKGAYFRSFDMKEVR